MATPSTNNPFNRRIAKDIDYTVTASLSAPLAALDFIQAVPYPTTTEKTVLQVVTYVNSATSSGVTASVYLQQSADNVTWVNIPQKAAPFTVIKQNTQVPITSSVITAFEPDGLRYVRASASISQTATFATSSMLTTAIASLTGSYGLTVLF